jgi:hypothetical protein
MSFLIPSRPKLPTSTAWSSSVESCDAYGHA